MKKFFTLIAVALMATAMNAQTTWNFSDWTAGEMAPENVENNGLKLYNASGTDADGNAKNYVFTIDSSKKTIDGTTYTQRLKTGGVSMWNEDGTPLARVMELQVSGPATIKVGAVSSSSSASDRCLDIYVGGVKKEAADYSVAVDAKTPTTYTYNYTGEEATTILIACSVGGINYYYVSVEGSNGGNGEGGETGEVTGGDKTWDISNWTAGEMAPENTLVDGMLVYNGSGVDAEGATKNYVFTVDSNKKKIDGVQYTQRLKTGGTSMWNEDGTPLGRVLAIKVAGSSTVKVGAVSSSSSASDRCLDIYVGGVKKETADYSVAVDAKTPTTYTYSYEGTEPTTLLIACSVGGINYYYISATNVEPITDITTGIEGLTIGQSTIDNCIYNLAGQKVGAGYKGIVIINGKKVVK